MSGLLHTKFPRPPASLVTPSRALSVSTTKDGQGRENDIESTTIIFTGRLALTKYWPCAVRPIQLLAYKDPLGRISNSTPSFNRLKDQESWPFGFGFPMDSNAVQNHWPRGPLSLVYTDHSESLPTSLLTCPDEQNRCDAVSIIYELRVTLPWSCSTRY